MSGCMAGKLNPVKLVLQQVSAARLEVLTHIPPPDSDWNRTICCSGLLLALWVHPRGSLSWLLGVAG